MCIAIDYQKHFRLCCHIYCVKSQDYVIAEKWLKRNKSISGILCERKSEIGESVCWVCGVVLSTAVRRFL